MCTVGKLTDPASGLAIRKRLDVRTSSVLLHTSLHGQWCSNQHPHQQISGNTTVHGRSMLRSKYTELYPTRFARQVAKILLAEKSKPEFALVNDTEHPTKKRRLGSKMSTAAIEARFPSVSWESIMKEADRMARRVGTLVVDEGPIIQQIQSMCSEHIVKHIVLCRGIDRHVGPNKDMPKGTAPVRRMICIRRKHEDIHVESEWEPWERLTLKGLRRKCVPARVSLTIFAQVRSKPSDAVPETLIHDRPASDNVPVSKRARVGNATPMPNPDAPITTAGNNPHDHNSQDNQDLITSITLKITLITQILPNTKTDR